MGRRPIARHQIARRTVGMGAAAGVAAVALAVALALTLAVALPGAVTEALAASPSPTLAAVGDPRSSGQGPGLVGDPLTAILLVALIAVAAVAATLAYVRATPGPRRNPGER